jgi:formylglycine-generating enzyme required for sulfatase activity
VGDVVKARAWRGDELVDLPAVRVRPGPGCTTVDWGAEAARCQVYVQYADASAKAAAQAVQRALGAVCEVAEGLDRKPVDRWAVRYFHAEDRGDAERVWRATRAEAPDVLLQDLSAQYPDAPLGQIEVWVPTEKPPDCVLAANSLSGKSSATELLAREVKERCRSLEIVFLDVEVDPWTIGFVQPAWEAAARRLAKQVRHYPKADAELPPWQVVKVSPGPGERSDVLYFFGDKSYTMLDLEAVGGSATAVAVDGGEAKALPATWALPAGSHRLAVGGGPEETVNLEADVDTRRCWQPKEQRWTEGPCQRPFNIPVVTFGPATFTMGSPADEEGRDENETQHKVTVPRRFALATTEVSQGLYREVMGTNPSRWDNGIGDDLPVNMVSWLDAVKFCTKLSLREGLTPAYSAPGEVDAWEAEDVVWAPAADGWRLPTEAEWELAARAAGEGVYGSTSEPAEVCRFANVADASAKAKGVGFGDERFPCDDGFVWLAPVGSLRAQAGLHHMLGNVWELTWDWYAEDITGETMDAGGPAGGVYRVYRGGSFNDPPRDVRVAGRTWFDPSFPYVYLGFRLARSLPSAL